MRRFFAAALALSVPSAPAHQTQTPAVGGCGGITFTILGDGPDDCDSFCVCVLTTPTYERVLGFARRPLLTWLAGLLVVGEQRAGQGGRSIVHCIYIGTHEASHRTANGTGLGADALAPFRAAVLAEPDGQRDTTQCLLVVVVGWPLGAVRKFGT